MPHPIEVQKVVLLPRYTSFSGARTFLSAPLNVRAFASADLVAWFGSPIGTSATVTVVFQESPDLKIWTDLATMTPTPGTEDAVTVSFGKEWVRIAVTLGGTNPGFTGWCVGDFVTRAPRGS